MQTLHRILAVFTFIAAVIAVVFSFLLYERRQELRQRGDMLAQTVADMAETFDRDSGTRISEIAHLAPMQDPAEPTRTWQDGTLGANNFHAVKGPDGDLGRYAHLLDAVAQQAKAVHNQRNDLADALDDVSETIEFDAEAPDFRILADDAYVDAITNLQNHVTKVRDRDRAITNAVAEAAIALNHPMDPDALRDLEDFRALIGDFAQRVELLSTRDADYAEVIAKLPELVHNFQFSFDPERLKSDPQYQEQLVNLRQDFAGIQAKLQDLNSLKIELRETEDSLENHVTALNDARDTLEYLDQRYAHLQAKHEVLKIRLAHCIGTPGDRNDYLPVHHHGEIVMVEDNYRFVIINLGAKDSISPNTVLKVGRDQEFLCNVVVSRVEKDYAVCEVEPKFRQSSYLAKGDRVIH